MFLCGLNKKDSAGLTKTDYARSTWSKFAQNHPCVQAQYYLYDAPAGSEVMAYKYRTKAGHESSILNLKGVEYATQHLRPLGVGANENRAKFLGLIQEWKKMEEHATHSASILGKRPAYRQGYHLPEAPGGPDQSSELSMVHMQAFQVMANGFKSVQVQHHTQITGELGLIKGEVATVNGGLGLLNGKVAGVETAITNVKGDVINEVKSVHAEVKKGNDDKIKKLEEQLREKDQQLLKKDKQLRAAEATRIKERKDSKALLDQKEEANKRQRYTISDLNKQRNEQLITFQTVQSIGTGVVNISNQVGAVATDQKKLAISFNQENNARKKEIAEFMAEQKKLVKAFNKENCDREDEIEEIKLIFETEVAALKAENAEMKNTLQTIQAENAEMKNTLQTILDAIIP